MPDPGSPRRPLHRDLRAAADLVGGVLKGESLASSLPRLAQAGSWSAAQRGAAQALSFTALRGLGRARALLALLHAQRIRPAELEHLLLVAIALLSLPEPARPYPDHTLVHEAVQACALRHGTRAARGLVNALLRRLQAQREALLELALQDETARHEHPAWWIARVRAAYPEDWEQVLGIAAEPPALTLRVNARWGSRDAYLELLRARGLDAVAVAGQDQALTLRKAVPVGELPLFDAGAVSVQDAAAQFAAPLLEVGAGMRVLDACAAPGGKTAHILELADCRVLALDQDPARAARIGATLQRLRLPLLAADAAQGWGASILVADASRTADWWDGRAFDRILLDAPCSAAGIVRRHPDIRWLRLEADIATLAAQQHALLEALWPLLAPGGRLLYATCSIFPEEGREQAAAFLRRHDDALALAAPGQILPAKSPERDGFFYALFAKRLTA
jgi:16S rRNA (cytosine967-C5)-methyltransferase